MQRKIGQEGTTRIPQVSASLHTRRFAEGRWMYATRRLVAPAGGPRNE